MVKIGVFITEVWAKKIIVYPLDPNNLPITRLGKVDRKRLRKELIE